MPINTMQDAELWKSVNNIEESVKAKNGVKEDALLELLEEAAAADSDTGGALRATEISDMMGWTLNKTRILIRKLKARDMIEVIPVKFVAIDDVVRPARAYRLIKDDDKALEV